MKHKLDGMINVKDIICIEKDCIHIASFNYKDEVVVKYCKLHKLVGMIDIKNRRCKEDECDSRPSYNISTEKSGIYCAKHKKMV